MVKGIKNLFYILTLALIIGCPSPSSTHSPITLADVLEAAQTVNVPTHDGQTVEILDASHLTIAERRARTAAVKVMPVLLNGHGSGTYMLVYGRRVVITAAHVVDDDSVMLVEGRDGERVTGRVVYRDHEADVAFIVVPEIKSRTAIKYRPQLKYDERLVGTPLTYTGFPSHHDLLTIRGYVSSLERGYIVTNMFGWFGSSGSGVFDARGRLVGVVSGIDIGRWLYPLPLEDIVWLAPISAIDHETLKVRILTADPMIELQQMPGAAAPRRGAPVPR